MSATVLSATGSRTPPAHPTPVAEYVKREKRSGTWYSVGLLGFAVLGGLLGAVLMFWAAQSGRSVRRPWVEYLRAQAAGAEVVLSDEERRVLRRAMGRRRAMWYVLLGLAAFALLAGVALAVTLANTAGAAGIGLGLGVFFAALVGGLGWVGVRELRGTQALIARLDGGAPVLGMRLRAPYVNRQIAAPPRFGGLPLFIVDQKWFRALQAADGREVELVLAPTFAEDPRAQTLRVPLGLPAGV